MGDGEEVYTAHWWLELSETFMDKIIQGDCLEIMRKIPDGLVDLVLTSPPYDDLREYNGYSFDFLNTAREIFRITKDGGMCVWVVSDKTKNGSETGTSFRQALLFKEAGFNLHDTMIWRKPNPMPHIQKNRYTPSFEYMFVFSKGKPKTANMLREPCKYAGKLLKTHTTNPESIRRKNTTVKTLDTKIKSNVFDYIVAGTNYGHPAIFPIQLAKDHIYSWSNEGDLVIDPFCGSGTTCVAAKELRRRYIGIDISKIYCEIAEKRIGRIL